MTRGEHMKAARKKAHLTLRQLQERSGVRYSIISALEREIHGPQLTTAEVLADALGISIDEYVGHKVKKKEGV